jgi:hypothetical protein
VKPAGHGKAGNDSERLALIGCGQAQVAHASKHTEKARLGQAAAATALATPGSESSCSPWAWALIVASLNLESFYTPCPIVLSW